MDCAACGRIERIRAGQDAAFIAELNESYAVLADDQRWEGWCVLLLKEHHEHLADLTHDRQARLFIDVARVADAIRRAFSPARLNYECLGNQMPHIHWHIIPRYSSERRARETVWVRPAGDAPATATAAQREVLAARVRRALREGREGGPRSGAALTPC